MQPFLEFDDDWGQSVHAVVRKPNALHWYDGMIQQDLDVFCKQALSKQMPRSYAFVEQLPRQENGKLYKRLLRDDYIAQSAT